VESKFFILRAQEGDPREPRLLCAGPEENSYGWCFQ